MLVNLKTHDEYPRGAKAIWYSQLMTTLNSFSCLLFIHAFIFTHWRNDEVTYQEVGLLWNLSGGKVYPHANFMQRLTVDKPLKCWHLIISHMQPLWEIVSQICKNYCLVTTNRVWIRLIPISMYCGRTMSCHSLVKREILLYNDLKLVRRFVYYSVSYFIQIFCILTVVKDSHVQGWVWLFGAGP